MLSLSNVQSCKNQDSSNGMVSKHYQGAIPSPNSKYSTAYRKLISKHKKNGGFLNQRYNEEQDEQNQHKNSSVVEL